MFFAVIVIIVILFFLMTEAFKFLKTSTLMFSQKNKNNTSAGSSRTAKQVLFLERFFPTYSFVYVQTWTCRCTSCVCARAHFCLLFVYLCTLCTCALVRTQCVGVCSSNYNIKLKCTYVGISITSQPSEVSWQKCWLFMIVLFLVNALNSVLNISHIS